MSAICDNCGKKPGFGKSVSRTGKRALNRRVKSRTSRRFNANIQRRRVKVAGTSKQVRLCTSCIKADKLATAV